jgi:uncharacterized protein YndB with AHSA1/START domain
MTDSNGVAQGAFVIHLLDDSMLVLKRHIEAPAQRVFDARLGREAWEAWMGPQDVNCQLLAF